ncbi:MAG: class II aldolase/adducin family protein, partial [Acidimicrobiia bacterium]|nr:class II aldolase/adducin family protein [Acidimicrobiia bacterium]
MSDGIIAALIDCGRQLHDSNLNAGTAGNLSALLGDGRVVMSKRRVRKAALTADDFVVFDPDRPDARALERASTEYRLHIESYRASPEVCAVVHAHPPALTAIGIRRGSFPPVLPELDAVVGPIVICPYEPSGSDGLAQAVGRAVGRGAGVV